MVCSYDDGPDGEESLISNMEVYREDNTKDFRLPGDGEDSSMVEVDKPGQDDDRHFKVPAIGVSVSTISYLFLIFSASMSEPVICLQY